MMKRTYKQSRRYYRQNLVRFVLNTWMLFLVFPSHAHAYIGPGLAGGTIAAILGLLVAFFLFFVGIVYYPLKRIVKKKVYPEQKALDTDTDHQDV